MQLQALRDEFAERFRAPCTVVARAPGRVNLIGEHTDYNDGFALPIAIEQSTWAAAGPRDDGVARVVSLAIPGEHRWRLGDATATDAPGWSRYVEGVAELLLARSARLDGFDLLIGGDVPVAGGLSSSAALTVSTALALAHLAGEPLETNELIDLCRRAEHEFAGVPCGLLDPTASLLGREDHALLIDFRTRKTEAVPLALEGLCLLVADCGVRHDLAAGEYARRQRECREAVAYFQRIDRSIRSLRDVPSESLRRHALQMDPLAAARAQHVVSENERTIAAVAAIRRGDWPALGRLMTESHRSLRDDYQVSCRELDDLVAALEAVDGVLGARMTGGGFGGCVVALLRETAMESLQSGPTAWRVGTAKAFPVRPGPGASIELG